MKKFFATAVAALFMVMNVNAQNEDLKHEIGVSYGLGISLIGDGIGHAISHGVWDAMNGREWANDKHLGTFGVEYFYHLDNPKLAVGGIVTYAQYGEDVVDKSDRNIKCGDRMRRYVSVMPAVKYSWVNKNHFALYSKVAAGVMFNFEKEKNLEKNTESSYSNTYFMAQVSLIGVEFGSKVRGFVELGGGEQGIFLLGMKYKF